MNRLKSEGLAMRQWGTILMAALVLACAVGPGQAQAQNTPYEGELTNSLGMPPVYKGLWGFEGQWYRPGNKTASTGAVFANLGLMKDLGSPVIGVGALKLEGYVGLRRDRLDGGGRAMFMMPSFYLGAGVDYGATDEDWVFLLELDVPLRRGGLLGSGSNLALRWLPARDNTFGAGVTFPLWNKNLGKTRPERDSVLMPRRNSKRLVLTTVPDELTNTLADLRIRSYWVTRMTQPYAERSGSDPHKAMAPDVEELLTHWNVTDEDFPRGHTANAEIAAYHRTLDLVFSLALDPSGKAAGPLTETGIEASAIARAILLEEVLLPYNRLLGQRKDDDGLSGLTAVAQAKFARSLLESYDPGSVEAQQAYLVFQTLCDIVEQTRQDLRKRWEDSRFVWLPLQFALRPEQHDTQAELDALIEKATQKPFTEGNRSWYFVNEQFQWEIARSVQEAEDYHVLWIHDYRGLNGEKNPDEMAYLQTRNYLKTLTNRVRDYDQTGKLPIYMIFLDQHYFEINKGRKWLRILTDPLKNDPSLPGKYNSWEEDLNELLADLRQAVAESDLLRVETTQYGEKWLHNRIKVQVNITNPADPSYFSRYVIGIMAVPDNNMRDHRKIAFYDISEEDPYRGAAMFTGMGIGEHYIGAGWEDRTIMIQGPGALAVKDAARDLLLAQGMSLEEIPAPLRVVPKPDSYAAKVETEIAERSIWRDDRLNLLQLHNQTGFANKPINVAKAVLYSLMPAGSVLQIPDSLWQSYIYASLLSGSSLRGCRTMIIAPTGESAPSAGAPQLARAHDLMGRIIVFANGLAEPIDQSGGMLAVGFYAPQQGVGDLGGRMHQAATADTKLVERIVTHNPGLNAAALGAAAQLDSLGLAERYMDGKASEFSPKMHLKANFLASGTAWDKLLIRPEWHGLLREYIAYLGELETPLEVGRGLPDVRAIPSELIEHAAAMMENFLADLSPEERESLVYYFTVGSVNLDYRSMCLDGEVMVTLSGLQSVKGVIDFLLLAGLCEWVDTTEELDALLPPPSGMVRSLAGLIKLIL